MRVICAASWIKRRGMRMAWMASIQSDFSGSLAPASSVVPLRCVVCLSLVPACLPRRRCRFVIRIRGRLCLPHRGYTPRHPSIMRHRSSACPICPIASSSLSLCLASPLAPSLVSSGGAMSYCGRWLLAFLIRAMWYQIGGGSVLLASCHR